MDIEWQMVNGFLSFVKMGRELKSMFPEGSQYSYNATCCDCYLGFIGSKALIGRGAVSLYSLLVVLRCDTRPCGRRRSSLVASACLARWGQALA